MNKNLNSNQQVKPTIKNIVHRVLYAIVHWMILYRLFHGYGKLKEGDFVRYNWKAKVYIRTVYDREPEVRQISKIYTYSDGTENCDFKPLKDGEYGGGCDSFWLRKLYFWERRDNTL
jgi:hypothetical protein